MKLLLDENVPRQLKRDVKNHEVYTIGEKKWNGKRNGELLKLMLGEGFDALITADKNLQHQQNFEKYPIPVLVLHTYRIAYKNLKSLIPKLLELLETDLPKGATIIKV
jgi:predicted nuclease of predicted toxin-antitoxin system